MPAILAAARAGEAANTSGNWVWKDAIDRGPAPAGLTAISRHHSHMTCNITWQLWCSRTNMYVERGGGVGGLTDSSQYCQTSLCALKTLITN